MYLFYAHTDSYRLIYESHPMIWYLCPSSKVKGYQQMLTAGGECKQNDLNKYANFWPFFLVSYKRYIYNEHISSQIWNLVDIGQKT